MYTGKKYYFCYIYAYAKFVWNIQVTPTICIYQFVYVNNLSLYPAIDNCKLHICTIFLHIMLSNIKAILILILAKMDSFVSEVHEGSYHKVNVYILDIVCKILSMSKI